MAENNQTRTLPTAETLKATAERFISVFDTLDINVIEPIQSKNYLHEYGPASIKLPAQNKEQYAKYMEHAVTVLSSFPVRAKQIWPNPSLKQVVVWATSDIQFCDEILAGEADKDEWKYHGEYIFVIDTDASGEKIEHVLEFLDSKGTEAAWGLMARALKKKEIM